MIAQTEEDQMGGDVIYTHLAADEAELFEDNCPSQESNVGLPGSTESLVKLKTQLDNVLHEHLHEIPGVIKSCGISSDNTMLNLRITPGKHKDINTFLDKYLGSHQCIKVIGESGKNVFLHGDCFMAGMPKLPEKFLRVIGRGSAVISLSPSEAESLDYSKDIGQIRKPFGTITCIMAQKNSERYFGLTAGHVLLDQAVGDHEWPAECSNKIIISDYKSPNKWLVTKIADSCSVGMGRNENNHFMDIGLFEIDASLIESGRIEPGQGIDHQEKLVLYSEGVTGLNGRHITKIGAETGPSFGMVTSVSQTVVVKTAKDKEIILSGIFIVSPLDRDGGEFAKLGDSGGPVFLENGDKNTIVGYISAGSCETVTLPNGTKQQRFKCVYCICLGTAIDYIHSKTELELEFVQRQGSSSASQGSTSACQGSLSADQGSSSASQGSSSGNQGFSSAGQGSLSASQGSSSPSRGLSSPSRGLSSATNRQDHLGAVIDRVLTYDKPGRAGAGNGEAQKGDLPEKSGAGFIEQEADKDVTNQLEGDIEADGRSVGERPKSETLDKADSPGESLDERKYNKLTDKVKGSD